MVSASSDFTRYRDIIKQFQEAHPRGSRIFEKIYDFGLKELLSIWHEHEWKRWYLYKKCVKRLEWVYRKDEIHISNRGHFSESTARVLRRICKEIAIDYLQNLQGVKKAPLTGVKK